MTNDVPPITVNPEEVATWDWEESLSAVWQFAHGIVPERWANNGQRQLNEVCVMLRKFQHDAVIGDAMRHDAEKSGHSTQAQVQYWMGESALAKDEVVALRVERDRYRDALASVTAHSFDGPVVAGCTFCDGWTDGLPQDIPHAEDCVWLEAQSHKDKRIDQTG